MNGSHECPGDSQRERHCHLLNNRPLRTRRCPRSESGKPRCPLHWLWDVADGRCVVVAEAGVEEPRTIPKLNSCPGPAFTWEGILDPIIWQLWPSMFLSQMRLPFFKDPFSFKYLWICQHHYTQIAVECWTAFTWNDWSLAELCWVQCIINIRQKIQWRYFIM